jgi:hypothetical protein
MNRFYAFLVICTAVGCAAENAERPVIVQPVPPQPIIVFIYSPQLKIQVDSKPTVKIEETSNETEKF